MIFEWPPNEAKALLSKQRIYNEMYKLRKMKMDKKWIADKLARLIYSNNKNESVVDIQEMLLGVS